MNDTDYIHTIRDALGGELLILAHHYQADSVVQHADIAGDSLELARKIPGAEANHIVFCGVSFMAETAAMLAGPGQSAYLPDWTAGCIMSAMAPAPTLEAVLAELSRGGQRIVPLTYVNSSVDVKAVVGRAGGSVCTSANARLMLEWAFAQGDAVLFLPDKNLALNTAQAMGLDSGDVHVLNIQRQGRELASEAADRARLLVWPGCCAVHHNRFKPEQILAIRAEYPEARIAVHPECRPEVVQLADGAGSTSFLIRYAAEAAAGARVYIGTEINLVRRLAERHKGEKIVLPLAVSDCKNMGKITEARLAQTLRDIEAGRAEPVTVDPETAQPAREAVQRMLDVCSREGK